MIKKYLILISLFSSFIINAVNINELADDYVIATVGEISITTEDLKYYMEGYTSIKEWNSEKIISILDSMITDLFFVNASLEEGITIKESEVYWYAEYYFGKLGIDINNAEKVQSYFDTSDPYYNMEDFLMKSRSFLLKSKYLMKKGVIHSYKVSHIFFSTEKLNKKEIEAEVSRVSQIVYTLNESNIPYQTLFRSFNASPGSGDIGEITREKGNQYIPNKELKRITEAGLFSPVYIRSKKGMSIVMTTSYALPPTNEVEKIIKTISAKYPVTNFLKF